MITAKQAYDATQLANRALWVESAAERIGKDIQKAASKGTGEVPFNKLIIGAENLKEAGEMLSDLNQVLIESGYKNTITLNGDLYITWKEQSC